MFKIIKLLILIVITSRPQLLNFLLGTGNKALINVGLMGKFGILIWIVLVWRITDDLPICQTSHYTVCARSSSVRGFKMKAITPCAGEVWSHKTSSAVSGMSQMSLFFHRPTAMIIHREKPVYLRV